MKIKKKLLIIVFIFSSIVLSMKIKAYDTYYSGDLVRYKNIAFYVLFDSDSTKDSVQLIKMVPLSHNEINRYTDNKAYLIKLYDGTLSYEESRGDFFGTMAYYYDNNCLQSNGNTIEENYSGCKNDYELSNVKKVIDAWVNENFELNDIVNDELGYKARLLNFNDYSVLTSIDDNKLVNPPNWLISDSSDTWVMEKRENCIYRGSFGGPSTLLFCYNGVYSRSNKYINSRNTFETATVRPTIILKKSSIKKWDKDENNEYHNNAKREYKIGDIINYNETQFYVIKNSSKEDNTVTLLKRYPLTKYELNTYGDGYINNYIWSYKENSVSNKKVIDDNGVMKVAYLSTSDCVDDFRQYSGCNPNYDVSNVKHIVDNWLNATINDSDLKSDSYGYKARLINKDDLIDLGFVNREANTVGITNFKRGNDTPLFMLDHQTDGMLTMIHSYTFRQYNGRVDHGITVADDGYNFVASSIPYNSFGTVSPVITLNKKEIAKKITNVEEDEEEENVIVNIATEVENPEIENDNLIAEVPDTLAKNKIIFGITGIILTIVSVVPFIRLKKN